MICSMICKRALWKVVVVVSLWLIFTAPVLAEDADLQQQLEALQQRVELLETEQSPGTIDRRVTLAGLLSAAYQYQIVDPSDNNPNGNLLFQPEVGIALSERDELFFKFGFAAGNGLNPAPFNLTAWAALKEDDVKDINGRNRDYLLTAWYAHTFSFSGEKSLQLTGGIIDSTDYLDNNAYSNDEHTQFMNSTLVNAQNSFLPSFDLGGVAFLELDRLELTAVAMNIGECSPGNSCNYFGTELQYNLETSLGDGSYRIILSRTSEAFPDPAGLNKEARSMVTFSFDQELGEVFGVWTRFGFEDDKPAIDYAQLLSGGVDISGSLWGRQQDNIGIGYAFVNGGNLDIESSQVVEAYSRFLLNEFFALTLDVQYMQDENSTANDSSGYVFGVRGVATF